MQSITYIGCTWRTLNLSIPHDVFYACSLTEKGINDRGPCWNEGGLAEEGKQGQDAVEGLELFLPLWPDSYTLAKFSQNHQVQDNWTG